MSSVLQYVSVFTFIAWFVYLAIVASPTATLNWTLFWALPSIALIIWGADIGFQLGFTGTRVEG